MNAALRTDCVIWWRFVWLCPPKDNERHTFHLCEAFHSTSTLCCKVWCFYDVHIFCVPSEGNLVSVLAAVLVQHQGNYRQSAPGVNRQSAPGGRAVWPVAATSGADVPESGVSGGRRGLVGMEAGRRRRRGAARRRRFPRGSTRMVALGRSLGWLVPA